MAADGGAPAVTEDAVLGGRLRLRQPRRGHRVGHDAILLAAAGLRPGGAQRVLMNPPFHDAERHNLSPDAGRRLAYAAAPGTLALWVDAAAWLLTAGGTLTLIWRADELAAVRTALARDFGAIAVLPVYSHPATPAIRVLVRAEKGSRAPPSDYAGLELNDRDGRPTAAAEAVLRHGELLPLAGA